MASGDLEILELKLPHSPIEKHNNDDCIERFRIQDISYNDFYWQYMERNYPVILTDVSTEWECRLNWIVTERECNIDNQLITATVLNYDYLKAKIGDCLVPVANCNREYFNSHAKCEMSFYEFLLYWQQRRKDRLANVNASSTELSNIDEMNKTTEDLLYLKDWHLKSQNASYDFYKVPKHFASDWLNEHLVACNNDDYRFVYMGPKDTWTPFHSDVFGSFSWSTNIMGTKKWLILPAGEEQKLCDNLGNLPFRIEEALLEAKNVKYFTIMQKENESFFVPSGWYHQVWNITDTISVNHNWFNACNLKRIWHNLQQQMTKVIKEIDDCRQMDNFIGHCQTMLRASFGLNYLDFLKLLDCITKRRLGKINNNTATNLRSPLDRSSNLIFFDQFTPNDYHILHDLERILQVIELMLQDTTICDDRTVLYRKCIQLRQLLASELSLNLSANE